MEIQLNLKKNNDSLIFRLKEIHGILGNQESQKEQMIQAFLCPSKEQAEVFIDGNKVDKANIFLERKIGISHKDPRPFFLFPTVREEFLYTLFTYSYKDKEKRMKDSLKIVGLNEEYLTKKIKELTFFEIKKVEMAKLLLTNPKILILEEPCFSFDPEEQKNMIFLLKKIKRQYQKMILIFSCDTNFLLQISDVLTLYQNKVLFYSKKEEFMKQIPLLKKYHLSIPPTMNFSYQVFMDKKVKLGYRLEVNDLIKDIYRNLTI